MLYDGGNQSGMLGIFYAARAVIERRRTAWPRAVSNIWMSGPSAYYVEIVARAGLIGVHTVAAPRWSRRWAAPRPAWAPIQSPSVPDGG